MMRAVVRLRSCTMGYLWRRCIGCAGCCWPGTWCTWSYDWLDIAWHNHVFSSKRYSRRKDDLTRAARCFRPFLRRGSQSANRVRSE